VPQYQQACTARGVTLSRVEPALHAESTSSALSQQSPESSRLRLNSQLSQLSLKIKIEGTACNETSGEVFPLFVKPTDGDDSSKFNFLDEFPPTN
jgi:hypothetical protein